MPRSPRKTEKTLYTKVGSLRVAALLPPLEKLLLLEVTPRATSSGGLVAWKLHLWLCLQEECGGDVNIAGD